jgi:hypothetical protein
VSSFRQKKKIQDVGKVQDGGKIEDDGKKAAVYY